MFTLALSSKQSISYWRALTLRHKLLAGSSLVIVLAILMSLQSLYSYRHSQRLFNQISDVNRTNVDASEKALQDIASTSQAAADYTALDTDTPLFESSQNAIFQNFNSFRNQMFILESNLQNDEERDAFNVAEVYTYNRFWRHTSNLIDQRADAEESRRQYLAADNHVRNQISPALQELERLNFQAMVNAGDSAKSSININLTLFFVGGFSLVIAITLLSFWSRWTLRRYLTPGFDIAMIASWILFVVILADLSSLKGDLDIMIKDAYFSISGSSRILVAANESNRAESTAIIDSTHRQDWYTHFDENFGLLEERLCGVAACTQQPFIQGNNVNSTAINKAKSAADDDSAALGGLPPLLANLTFTGEIQALEQARLALVDYQLLNTQIRERLEAGDNEGAIALNIGTDEGQSDEAYQRFVAAIEAERQINLAVYDDTWADSRAMLDNHQRLYAIIGYLVVILACLGGTYHRYSEL